MPKKPRTSTAITVSWESYKVLKDKAISEDTNIKQIVEDILTNSNMGEGSAPESKEKAYVCPYCDLYFENKDELRGHALGEHGEGIKDTEIELENV